MGPLFINLSEIEKRGECYYKKKDTRPKECYSKMFEYTWFNDLLSSLNQEDVDKLKEGIFLFFTKFN